MADTPFNKGKRIGLRGLPKSRNPYTPWGNHAGREEWNKGWQEGMDTFLNGKGYRHDEVDCKREAGSVGVR